MVRNASMITRVVLTAGGLLCPSAVAWAQCGGYEVTAVIHAPDCPPFGIPPTIPTAINSYGHVCGYYFQCTVGSDRAFVWTPEGGFVSLDPPPGTSGLRALDINDNGWIVGNWGPPGALNGHGFLWIDGEWFDIPAGTVDGRASAIAINNANQITGYRDMPSGLREGFLWEDGQFTMIAPPSEYPRLVPCDVDDSGTIVGWTGVSVVMDSVGFEWTAGVLNQLGPSPDGLASGAHAIAGGTIAGFGMRDARQYPPNGTTTAVSWIEGVSRFVETPSAFQRSAVRAMRGSGLMVGRAWGVPGDPNAAAAVVWSDQQAQLLGDLVDIDEFDLALEAAIDITPSGMIVVAADADSDVVGAVLTPIAQPDLDDDRVVGEDDLALLLGDWGNRRTCSDLNNDGLVDGLDLGILLANWGTVTSDF